MENWPQYRNMVINIGTIMDEDVHEAMLLDIEKLLEDKYNYSQFSRKSGKDEMCESVLRDEVTFYHRNAF